MGLTIHYSLCAPGIQSAATARRAVTSLQKFAKTLPFMDISKILTWKHGKDDPVLRDHFTHHVLVERSDRDPGVYFAKPLELIFFVIQHEGSESPSFGLGRFEPIACDMSDSKSIPSNLGGWRWQNACKTQYASLSNHGGFQNFFNIHDGICQILRCAQSLGITADVLDESKYWEHRDPERLRAEIARWNHMVAAVVGAFQDHAPGGKPAITAAPILEAPEFEHLEAKGQHFLREKPDIHIIRNPKPRRRKK